VPIRAIVAAACAVLVIAAAPASDAQAGVPGLNAAKAFHKYPVYWAGSEVMGLPLESVQDYSTFEKSAPSGWAFGYGSCELSGSDHPSCPLPLQIQVSSTCKRWASELLPKGAHPFGFRGAKAVWHPGIPLKGGGTAEVGPLEIFTGRTTVVIFTEERALAFTAARRLHTVHQARPSPLPPPVAGSLWGRLPCQKGSKR
jgi:hypothetical protein